MFPRTRRTRAPNPCCPCCSANSNAPNAVSRASWPGSRKLAAVFPPGLDAWPGTLGVRSPPAQRHPHICLRVPEQIILSRGNPGREIYLVLEGRIRLSILFSDGANSPSRL
jgi:hypothetical protein